MEFAEKQNLITREADSADQNVQTMKDISEQVASNAEIVSSKAEPSVEYEIFSIKARQFEFEPNIIEVDCFKPSTKPY